MMMDEADRKILGALQQDAQLTAQELSERVNLSPSQAGRRRQRLEEQGVINRYAARLNNEMLGLHVQAFIQVQMATHMPEEVRKFTRKVEFAREVVNAWTLTGDADYLLHVFCADLAALNRLIHEIILPEPAVARVQSQIVMAHLKTDAPLPI